MFSSAEDEAAVEGQGLRFESIIDVAYCCFVLYAAIVCSRNF